MTIKDYAQSIVLQCHGEVNLLTDQSQQLRLIYRAMPALSLLCWLDQNPDADIVAHLDKKIARLTEEYRGSNMADGSRIRTLITTLYDLRDHVTACQVAQQVNH